MPEKKQLTAVHVCWISPVTGGAGYEIRIVEETRLLRQQGVRVVILCFVRQDQFFPLSRLWKFHQRLNTATGARVYLVPTARYFELSLSPQGDPTISRTIRFVARLHGATILHGQALYSTMHALRARRGLDTKVVFEVHGASPEEAEMGGSHPNRVQTLAQWEKDAFRRADHFNFVSWKMKEYMERKYGLEIPNSAVVPCCVHLEKFAISWDERERKRRELGIHKRFVVAYLGTLTVWQWPEAIFSLFAQLYQRNQDFFLYLLIPVGDHEKARTFITQCGIPSDAYRLEEVPHDKVGTVLGVADAGLLLRKRHPVNEVSSPTKFGEYLAAGVPVIATDGIGDTSELVAKEKLGIIVNATDCGVDEQDLGRLLEFSAQIVMKRKEVAPRCVDTAKKYLDWDAQGSALVDGYQKLIALIIARLPE